MFSINQNAVRIVKEQIIPRAEELNCRVIKLMNGATVVDMGIVAPGGWMAGKLFVEACIGGQGHVSFGRFQSGRIDLPSIDVYIDHPQEACLASQFSGWKMPSKDIPGYINPIGSGPARALARNDIFWQAWPYEDMHHETVFAAQSSDIPGEQVAEQVAAACKVKTENVYIIATKTCSVTGAIQVCSRTVEASIWRLHRKGLNLASIISGAGTCPIPPPIHDELKGMDRVNTALIYGASVRFLVNCADTEVEQVIAQAPFNASRRFGERFIDLFEEGKRDFYLVDKDIHTIARYEITNYATGRTFQAGVIREDRLLESLF